MAEVWLVGWLKVPLYIPPTFLANQEQFAAVVSTTLESEAETTAENDATVGVV
jgi:hypothetical protein